MTDPRRPGDDPTLPDIRRDPTAPVLLEEPADPLAEQLDAGEEDDPTSLAVRLDAMRRHYLPLPDELVHEYLGDDEYVIHTDHPSFRAFLIQNIVQVLGLGAAGLAFLIFVRGGFDWWTLLFFLVLLGILMFLAARRLSDHYTSYVITNLRLIRLSGIFGRKLASIPWTRMTGLGYRQKPMGRILGYATIFIESANEESGLREFSDINDPAAFHQKILDMVSAKSGQSQKDNPTPTRGERKSFLQRRKERRSASLERARRVAREVARSRKSSDDIDAVPDLKQPRGDTGFPKKATGRVSTTSSRELDEPQERRVQAFEPRAFDAGPAASSDPDNPPPDSRAARRLPDPGPPAAAPRTPPGGTPAQPPAGRSRQAGRAPEPRTPPRGTPAQPGPASSDDPDAGFRLGRLWPGTGETPAVAPTATPSPPPPPPKKPKAQPQAQAKAKPPPRRSFLRPKPAPIPTAAPPPPAVAQEKAPPPPSAPPPPPPPPSARPKAPEKPLAPPRPPAAADDRSPRVHRWWRTYRTEETTSARDALGALRETQRVARPARRVRLPSFGRPRSPLPESRQLPAKSESPSEETPESDDD